MYLHISITHGTQNNVLHRKGDPETHVDWIKSMTFPSDFTKGKRLFSQSLGGLVALFQKEKDKTGEWPRIVGICPEGFEESPTCMQDSWSHNRSCRQIKKISTWVIGQILSSEKEAIKISSSDSSWRTSVTESYLWITQGWVGNANQL